MFQKLKKSFSILELIIVIVLIGIISSQTIYKKEKSMLNLASDKMLLYLNYTRYIAHIDNKFNINDTQWMGKLWTLKFRRCSKDSDGLYYVIYSDMSGGTAHFKKEDCLKDPLNFKYLYSTSDCKNSFDKSKYILLTKEFGIVKVDVSCNTTDSLGQISFGYDGKVYSQLKSKKIDNNNSNIKEYITIPVEIEERCYIKLYDKDDKFTTIMVEPKTGYIQKIN
jgi:hypothetical protein